VSVRFGADEYPNCKLATQTSENSGESGSSQGKKNSRKVAGERKTGRFPTARNRKRGTWGTKTWTLQTKAFKAWKPSVGSRKARDWEGEASQNSSKKT